MKTWFLRFHRWLALAFAAPLAVVIVTGLVLSFEPWLVTNAIDPGSLTAGKIQTLLAQHDPNGQARMLVYRSYDGTLTMGAGRGGVSVTVDADSGEVRPGPSMLASVMGTMRGLHERLLLDAGWLVIASTAAMLVMVVIGGLIGWPRFANSLGGWHKAVGWGLLPLTVLSPLSGLLMVAGITFATPAGTPATEGAPPKLTQAVAILGRDHDLSSLVWMRPMGGGLMARLAEDGEYRVYDVTSGGAKATERNWPRLWHEGTFAGAWSAAMNVILSVVMTGLLGSGILIWARRQRRRRARRLQPTVPA